MMASSCAASWHRRLHSTLLPTTHTSSFNVHEFQAKNRNFLIRCQGWFEFNSDLSEGSANRVNAGDFKVLSHLRELGCGDLVCKPKAIHFRGCINESYTFDCTGGRFFVKINRALGAKDLFAGEYEGLQKVHASQTICVPKPLGFGDLPDCGSYIIMEHLEFRPFGMMQRKSQEALGKGLAILHQHEVGDLFGFPLNTRLGLMPLENTWATSWAEFFIEKRLKDRLKIFTIEWRPF